MVQSELKKGSIVGQDKMSKEMKSKSLFLEINSINYDSIETSIRFCGPGNMVTGDSCFTYNYGNEDLPIDNNKNSGCERVKISEKWYKEFIYFD